MADIKFTLTADNSNLNKALDDSMKEIRTMGKAVGASANDINKAFSKLGKELVKNVGAEKALNALKQKLKAQSGVVDELKKRYAELDEQMAVLEKNGGKAKDFANIQEYEKLKEELKDAQKEYDQLSAAMEGATKQSNLFSTSVNGQVYEGESVTAVVKQMEEEMRRMRDAGKENTEEFARLNAAAANLKDNMLDTKQAINKMASDTAKLDTVLGGLNVVAGGFSAVTGAMEMFGAESDNVAEAQKKLQAAIAITTGLTSIQNNFQKQSSLMQGIMLVQEKARAKANNMLAAAQGKATIAQRLFNAVAKANPYVLLATALVTVVGALAAFALSSSNANKEQKKAAERTKLWAEYVKTLADNQAALNKVEIDAAKHAADMAEAEGKSKREVIALQEKQLALEKQLAETADHTYTTGIVGINFEVHDYVKELEDNRKKLLDLQADLSSAKSALGSKKKVELKDGTIIDQDYIDMLQADVDAMQTYVDMGDAVVEMQRNLEVSAAKLAEAKRQLALADEQANTAAKRTTQDLQTGLMDDKYEQPKKQTEDNYNRQIEDIKTRLANEKNLTETERAELNKQIALLEQTRDKELERMRREHLNEMVQAEADAKDKIISIQNELADEQTSTMQAEFDKLAREREQRLRELTDQEESWIKEQGGLIDAEGHYTDTSKLTEQQKEYLKQAREAIDKMYGDGVTTWGTKLENTIFESYATGLQKALREQDRLVAEKAFLQSKGRDTTEVNRQIGENALAYMQSEEQEINPEFERWLESLVNLTGKTLEGMLANAEEELATLANSPDADPKKVLEARARVAALRKELKAANKDINRGADVKKYENLNKILGDAAKGFEELGQTGNEAFDSIMKDVSEVLTSVQSVVGNIQTLVTSSIEAEKQAAKEGASAVKAVEKASVILAIIGAVISLAMKLKSMIDDTGDLTAKLNENVEKLRSALAQVKRELAVDVSGNKSIFGENQFKDLQQYAQAATDYADAYQQAVDKVAKSGFVSTLWKNAEGRKTFEGQKAYDLADLIFDQNDIKAYGNSLNEAINTMLDQTQIKTREKGWLGLRKEKYESLREVLGDDVNLIGKSDEETIKNLQALLDTQDELPPETKKVIEEMIADWDTYNEAIEGVKSTFANFFSGMTDAFADSIKTGFEEGAGAGKAAFSKSVNEMVSDFVLQMRIGERTAKMQEEYTQKMTDAAGDRRKEKDVAIAYADELKRMYDEEMDYYEDLQSDLEARGYGLKDALDGTLSGAIKGASQESIDLLSGYCNAVRIQQVDGINIMRDQLISLSGIERNTLNTNTILTAIRGDLAMQFASDDVRAAG